MADTSIGRERLPRAPRWAGRPASTRSSPHQRADGDGAAAAISAPQIGTAGHPDPLLGAGIAELVGWSLGAITVTLAGVKIWGGTLQTAIALPASMLLIIAGLAALVAVWARRRVPTSVQLALLALAALGCVVTAAMAVLGSPSYGTDELAFDQYAAQLLLHGANPYLHSMAPSLGLFHVPDIFRTYTLTGKAVDNISYPAGAFLLYLPALAVGMHMQAAVVTDVAAWVIAMFVAWRLLPPPARWVTVPLLLSSVYLSYAIGGVTDMLYLPFLLGALWRWDRFADPAEGSLARYGGPVLLGIACSVKQLPWFLVPFLLAGVAVEAHHRGQSWRRAAVHYAALAVGTFALINAPFAVRAPELWAKDVLLPFLAPTVPAGQGLIGFTLFAHLGGDLRYYTLAGILAATCAGLSFLGWYAGLRRAFVFLVPLAMFWPTRSLAAYLIMLLPAALVAATTVRPAAFAGFPWIRRSSVVVCVALFGCAVVALVMPPALRISVTGESSTGELQTIDYLTVSVHNASSRPVRPHYAVTQDGRITSYWNISLGPQTIPPRTTRIVELEAPNYQSMPSINGGFILDAFSDAPAQMASSATVQPQRVSTVLSPEDVNRRVAGNHPVHLSVQLTNQIGDPVRVAGVPVALGQVVYSELGLIAGQTSINNSPEGQTPVVTETDAAGIAHFVVRGVQPQAFPVFFQAWIQRSIGLPIGYSNVVSIQFVASTRASHR